MNFFTIKDFQQLCKELNIIIEKSIGLTSSGKQFIIKENSFGTNLFTREAIFLLSYKKYEPIKKLYGLFKTYINEEKRIEVNIPFPEINRRIKGLLAISVKEEVWVNLKHEKF